MKWDIIITSWLRLLLKVWILIRDNCCWNCEFDTDVKIENYYHHDRKHLGFYKKSTHQSTEQKERCSCNL